MPPTIIPNKLSFIWVGTALPERYAVNVLRWAQINPNYEVHLWTEEQNIPQHIKTIQKAYNESPEFNEAISEDVFDTFSGSMVGFFREHDLPLQVFVEPIETLPAIMDPTLLYEELTTWKNYGAASDILRLWVLNHIGGIYMDMDTYPNGGSIPIAIQAPHGILLCERTLDAGGFTLITPIIASKAGEPWIRDAAATFEMRYMYDYPQENAGVRGISSEHQARLLDIVTARADMAARGGVKTLETRAAIQISLVIPSLQRVCGIFMRSIGPTLNDFSLSDFSFQQQSGYWPIVGNESTWKQ